MFERDGRPIMSSVRDIEWTSYGETVLQPLPALLTAGLIAYVFAARRTNVFLPLMIVCAWVAHTQRIVILDLDFSMQRLVVLAALARILIKKEYRTLRFETFDKYVVAWVVCSIVMGVVGSPSISTFVNRMGFSIDSLGMYLVARSTVRSPADIVIALRLMVWVLVPISVEMVYETMTGQNLFHYLGAREFVAVRDGRLRCSGALGHPILMGSLGAGAIPMMVGLFFMDSKSRTRAALGAISGFIIALTSASSGPALSCIVGLAASGVWFARRWLKQMLWGVSAILIVIHVIREKPVWHLIGRMSDLVGGTGYHRVRLIDATIDHFGEWWLAGSKNAMYWGWGLQDTTNWYIGNALQGGLLTLLAFLAMLVYAFRSVGFARREAAKRRKSNPREARSHEILAWGLGASLVSHCFAWLSVAYFGTMKLLFFQQLAFYAAIAVSRKPALGRRPASSSRKLEPVVELEDSSGAQRVPSAGLNQLLKPDRMAETTKTG